MLATRRSGQPKTSFCKSTLLRFLFVLGIIQDGTGKSLATRKNWHGGGLWAAGIRKSGFEASLMDVLITRRHWPFVVCGFLADRGEYLIASITSHCLKFVCLR